MLLCGSIDQLAYQVGKILTKQQLMITTAESCTGGWISQALTSIPKSSAWFDRAFITYSKDAKQSMIGVSGETITKYSAVSEPVAKEMALGALRNANADISIAVTGVAGPDKGHEIEPVGTVWIAIAKKISEDKVDIATKKFYFEGDRVLVRQQTVQHALTGVLELFK